MWKVALKELGARKLRFVLTALAVTLGVTFMAGTMVLTDTLEKSFDELFSDINENTDAQVRGKELLETDFGESLRANVPAATVEQVRAVDGVVVAEPGVEIQYAQMIDQDGEKVGNCGAGPPCLGFNWGENDELNPFVMQPGGRAPESDDEVVIDKKSADDGKFALGDRVKVLTRQDPKDYTLVGIVKFGTVDSPGGATITSFTMREAQRINDLRNEYSNISVIAENGISENEIRTRIAADLSGEKDLEVVTGAQLTEEDQDEIREGLGFFSTVLLVFAFIALFVGSFIIYNTFSIIVAQRTREMALLRAVGASRRQVMGAVVLEAIAVGLFSSALGLIFGIALSSGLRALLNAIGFNLPSGSIVISSTTVITAFVVGTVITVLSAVIPARKASRVPPVAAMRDVAFERRAGIGRRAVIGTAISVLGAVLLTYGLFGAEDNQISFVGSGAFIIFIGVFVLGPVFARPFSRVIGAPLPRLRGMTGTLARENASRNPRRTSATAAALMIGVALVGFITVFAASTKKSIASAIDEQFTTDYIVTGGGGFGGVPLSPKLAEQLAELPELEAVTPLRFDQVKIDGKESFIVALAPQPAAEMFDIGITGGNIEELEEPDTIALGEEWATDHDLAIGDELPIEFNANETAPLRVAVLYDNTDFFESHIVSIATFDVHALTAQRVDWQIFANLAPGVTTAQGERAINRVIENYPIAELNNIAQYKDDQAATINQVVNMVYVLLALSVFIALIGIANTLALSIYERTREIGLLRAVGMGRDQVRSAIRWESVIISLLGTALGLAVGLLFGWAVVAALRDEGIREFALAPFQLAIVVILAALAGVGAAILPARRASNLDVLRSISSE